MTKDADRPRKRWRWLGVLVALAALYVLSGMTRSLGIHPVLGCPEQTLSPAEVQALFEEGVTLTEQDMMGEYRLMSSIDAGLPLLKTAAHHGHRDAMAEYRGHFIRLGAIEMMGIDGLSSADATAEGMMWIILGVHLGDTVKPHDAETFEVLLDPEVDFPDGFFNAPTGTAWMFQMLSHSGLDWARQQAYAWRGCWPELSPRAPTE